MIGDLLNQFKKWLDGPLWLLLGLTAGLGVVLLPIPFGNSLPPESQDYLCAGFKFSLAMTLAKIANIIWEKQRHRRWLRKRQRRIQQATKKEADILLSYLEEQTRTMNLDSSDGVVMGLVAEGILVQATEFRDITWTDFNLSSWAADYIEAHPEIIRNSASVVTKK